MKRSYIHIVTDDKNSLRNKSSVSKYGKLKLYRLIESMLQTAWRTT